MFTEDLSLFVADFGAPASVAGQPVRAIFDAPSALGDVGPLGMAVTHPTLTLRTAELPADPVGRTVVVAGRTYLAIAHEPDGTGMSRLLLEVA